MTLREGDPAPDFSLESVDGGRIRLEDLRGRKVVVYFYPKDDTPGCTKEACEFQEVLPRITGEDVVLLGISPDPVSSHEDFRRKYSLDFPLLADEDHAVAEAFDVWKEKSMYGKTYWGVERTTFLIDEEGGIERMWRKVRPEGHAAEVASAIEG